MEPIKNYSERIREIAERCAKRLEDPEYQRNAARLAAENEAQARAQAESARNQALLGTGIPLLFWPYLDGAPEVLAEQKAAEFLADPRPTFLVLAGKKGLRKTSALCRCVWAKRGRFTCAQELVMAGSFDRALWGDLEHAPVLGLDELGAEHPNTAFEAALYALLNKRHENLRKTVIATNLDAPGFARRYAANGLDRLAERIVKGGMWVNLDGPSMRPHWTDREED